MYPIPKTMSTTKLEIADLEKIITLHNSNQRKEDDADFYLTLGNHPNREELINLYEKTNNILITLYNIRLDYWMTKSKEEKLLIRNQYNEVSIDYFNIKNQYQTKFDELNDLLDP
jgi:hypothetical protein